jgi:DNA-binding transcriptional LysR family regulator
MVLRFLTIGAEHFKGGGSHGDEVYRAAKQLMQDVRGFEARVATTRDTLPGVLEIGLIDNMVGNEAAYVTATLADLHAKMPNLSLRVSVHSFASIDVLVRERRLNLGFTGKPDFLTPLHYVPAFVEEHRLYVSRDCPQFSEIEGWQPGNGAAALPYVARSFASEPFTGFESETPLRVTAVGASLEGVLAGVVAGFGCGILPIHAARRYPRLVALPYPDGGLRVPFHMVVREDALTERAVATFLRLYRLRADAGAKP